MCGPEDPLFTPLLPLARVPFQAKESVHKTPFWENFEILASTASIFTQILAHKPPNLEIFSSQAPKFGSFQLTSPQIWKFSAHKPPFSEANVSSQAPYFGNPGRTPLPEKSWVPPPGAQCSVALATFDGLTYFWEIWPLVDPLLLRHDLWSHQWITLCAGVLSTKFGGHRGLLSNMTSGWPLIPIWPLTPAMHYTLVRGSSYQIWWL